MSNNRQEEKGRTDASHQRASTNIIQEKTNRGEVIATKFIDEESIFNEMNDNLLANEELKVEKEDAEDDIDVFAAGNGILDGS